MNPEKPATVDPAAWWSPSDREWILADKDDEGRMHGRVTYWRPDGTLVNHCDFVHGTPHGAYTRYHESGEISRQGTLVRGQLQGTDVFFRSDSPTTENFPPGLGDGVWRAEMDMVGGRVVAGRLFDRQGRQVAEDGSLCPDRPKGVPDDATYSSSSGRWVWGRTDEAHLRTGEWRFYTEDGWVQQRTVYEAGEVLQDVVHANEHHARASTALADGKPERAVAIAEGGLRLLDDDTDRLELTALLIRAVAVKDPEGAAVRAENALAESSPGAGWTFTRVGQRAQQVFSDLHALLAEHHLAKDTADVALDHVRHAIAYNPQPSASLLLLEARIHRARGDEDAEFTRARQALAIDEDLDGLSTYRDDPRFAVWLTSIDPSSMTEEGAWEILGERGEKLEQYQGVVVPDEDDEDEAEEPAERQVFDPSSHDAWLDGPVDLDLLPEDNPELTRFAELASTLDITAYRSELVAVGESTLSEAVQCIDGNWLGRIQSVFLPASLVALREESMMLASWRPTSHGTSAVYHIHQDDREFFRYAGSLSGMVVEMLDLDDDDEELTISARTRARWQAAQSKTYDLPPLDDPFELLALEPRTHWIVNLLVGKHPDILSEIHLGDDIATAASRDDWEQERTQLAWPHLQAYWMLHHAVFGDLEALAEVVEHADTRYPGVADLLPMARQLLAGEPVSASFWNTDRVQEYRMKALEERPELLTEAARAQLAEDNEAGFAADAQMKAALESLSADPDNQKFVGFLSMLDDASGRLEAFQEAFARNWDLGVDMIMAMKNGKKTTFEDIYRNMTPLPEKLVEKPERSEPVRQFFEAALVRGASSPDDHKNTMPGTLYGLGMLDVTDAASFEAFVDRVRAMPFHPDAFGPYRRLEITMLAEPYLATSTVARDFVRTEAARYSAQSRGWGSDTFDYADRVLTSAGDEQQLQALNDRLAAGGFSGPNWKESIALCAQFLANPSPVVVPGLQVAVEEGLGRHDDGDRATVIRAYARCAGPDARARIDHWLQHIDDVRADCERAALLAGRLEVDVGTEHQAETAAEAQQVLSKLATRSGSMQLGAALSLLKTVQAHGLPGFRDAAEAAAARAADESYGSDELKAWIQEEAASFEA